MLKIKISSISLRTQIYEYVEKKYNSKIEYLWLRYPNYAVFRNNETQKWYGIIMDIPYNKLDIEKSEIVDVLNVKVSDYLLKDFLIHQPGIFNAYHMGKNWISVLLDGTIEISKIFKLLDESYNLVCKPKKQNSKINPKT